jgi:prepilin-type N-terminal cleavage/methylation domain-containing protein
MRIVRMKRINTTAYSAGIQEHKQIHGSLFDSGIRGIRLIRDIRDTRDSFSGFTLIEVLIAMAIIGIGLITLLTLFPIGLRSSRLAGDFTTASFIGQQALDNIRANAQVYDPADTFFDNTTSDRVTTMDQYTNQNGLGYYELPISAVKGYLSPLRFPEEPARAQTWTIEITSDHTISTPGHYKVTGSIWGVQDERAISPSTYTEGIVDTLFTSDSDNPDQISFVLADNRDGPDAIPGVVYNEFDPPYNSDKDYDEFTAGDKIVIHIEMVAGVPYYWYAMRAPVTEDQDLDGILDGELPSTFPPNRLIRSGGHGQKYEDTGLDLIPDYWDTTNSGFYVKSSSRDGEFSNLPGRIAFPGDPHGDNCYAYNSANFWRDTTTVINPNGTEANGKIDQYSDDDIQKVTVVVGWREGGQDRSTTFSASIANQYR